MSRNSTVNRVTLFSAAIFAAQLYGSGSLRGMEIPNQRVREVRDPDRRLFSLARWPNPSRGAGRRTALTDAIERALVEIRFGSDGLVPAVAQQYDTGEILMLAWMNRDAVQASLKEGRACYWSRSRGRLWRKGESSGQVQLLRELRVDCDGDAVLLIVDQQGVACHTGRRSCFFHAWRDGKWTIIAEPLIPPETLYPASPDR